MPLFELVAMCSHTKLDGGRIVEKPHVIVVDLEVFAKDETEAKDIFHELNGEQLIEARKIGEVTVLCRPFCS